MFDAIICAFAVINQSIFIIIISLVILIESSKEYYSITVDSDQFKIRQLLKNRQFPIKNIYEIETRIGVFKGGKIWNNRSLWTNIIIIKKKDMTKITLFEPMNMDDLEKIVRWHNPNLTTTVH